MAFGDCRVCGQTKSLYRDQQCMTCYAMSSEAESQIDDATIALDRPADAYVRWPWPSLDQVYGGMGPAQVHYVVGFSGLGKTTFIASAIREWVKAGVSLDVLPLEQKAEAFRAYLACQDVGIDPGLMFSGDFHHSYRQHGYPSASSMRDEVRRQMQQMQDGQFGARVRIHATSVITVDTLHTACDEAKHRGAQLVIVDHVDHLQPSEGGSEWTASLAVNRAALALAKHFDLCLVLMSQANQEMLRKTRDHLAKYGPLMDSAVYMGSEKRKIATGMIGLFRPVRGLLPNETSKEYSAAVKAARDNIAEPQTVLEPNVSGVLMMKLRHYGSREGRKVYLGWDKGRTVELPLDRRRDLDAALHGIRTAAA
jgi:KaiC/GvpD/RAD55 family RecA-like ATPase